jgi:hypothetical protein
MTECHEPLPSQDRRPLPPTDPRHVEGYMGLPHGTLDRLSPQQFRAEVALAVACIAEGGIDTAEKLAQSYGPYPFRLPLRLPS